MVAQRLTDEQLYPKRCIPVTLHPPQAQKPSRPRSLLAERRGPALMLLAGVYVLGFIAMVSSPKAGVILLVSVNVMLALIDWNAFVSLGDLVHWSRLHPVARVGMVALLLTGCVAPPVVLARELRSAWLVWRRPAPLQ